MKLILLLSLLPMLLFAQLKEFVIKELSAPETPVLSRSHPTDAIVIIYSSITDLNFESNTGGISETVTEQNKYTLYLKTERQTIKIKASGFREEPIRILKMEARQSKYFSVEAKQFGNIEMTVNLIEIVFELNEDSVFVSYGDLAPIRAAARSVTFKIPVGEYVFRFQKNGFKDETKGVSVNDAQRISVEMQRDNSAVNTSLNFPGIIVITSDPDNSEVLINGIRLGNTRYQGELTAGDHQLEVRKPFYHPEKKSFRMEAGQTMTLPITLKPKFGYLTVASEITGSSVFLDGKEIGKTPLSKFQVESADHKIVVSYDLYHDYSEQFSITDGEEKYISAQLKPAFGSLKVTTSPEDGASVLIDGQLLGQTPYTNNKIRSGKYLLKVSKELFGDIEEQIEIKDESALERNLQLNQNFGSLSVSAPESQIFLNDNLVGSGSYSGRLLSGNYKVKADRGDKYYPAVQEFFLSVGSSKNIKLEPQPRLGSVSVFVEPNEASDAEIFVNNEPKGNAPIVIPLLIGDYNITARKNNYLDVHESISIYENESKKINFSMLTYEGSQRQIADRWSNIKWISWGASLIAAGGMTYFYFSAEKNFDYYNSTTNSAAAYDYRKTTNYHNKLSNILMYAASSTLVTGLISWIIEASY